MDYKVISSDDHVVEPPDIFERRLPARLRARAPRVRRFGQEDRWVIGERVLVKAGADKPNLKTPHDQRGLVGQVNYDTCEPGVWQPQARLKDYDANGVDAAVLFPDYLPGFTGNPFWSLADDPELRLEVLKAWNDWLVEDFCSVAPDRLIAQCLLPVWDVQESVKELERCAKKGHRAIMYGGVLDIYGLPSLFESHWDPIWAAAQDTGLPITLHQQSFQLDRKVWTPEDRKNLRGLPLALVTGHVANTMVPLVDFLFSGIPERFPRLQFYIGEGGVGWIPYILTQADFFWRRRNRSFVDPELSMPPSQYWRRQFSAGFWYERIDDYILDQLGEDNVLWEDDYPHQLTDIGIGDGSSAYIDFSLERVTDPQVRHKILAGNAVRVFKLG